MGSLGTVTKMEVGCNWLSVVFIIGQRIREGGRYIEAIVDYWTYEQDSFLPANQEDATSDPKDNS
jgi:hypothetical protein